MFDWLSDLAGGLARGATAAYTFGASEALGLGEDIQNTVSGKSPSNPGDPKSTTPPGVDANNKAQEDLMNKLVEAQEKQAMITRADMEATRYITAANRESVNAATAAIDGFFDLRSATLDKKTADNRKGENVLASSLGLDPPNTTRSTTQSDLEESFK